MNVTVFTSSDAAAQMEHTLTVLSLRLRHEVALHRALRGDTGREGFSGLLLDGDEAERVLLQMAGRLVVSGTAEPLAVIERLEAEVAANRRHKSRLWAKLDIVFDLTPVMADLLTLVTAPSIDPRFGRVYGFLSDDLACRMLTPALALRMLSRHRLGLADLRQLVGVASPLVAHGLINVGAKRPLIDAPLGVDEEVVDWLLGAECGVAGTSPVPKGGPWLAEKGDRVTAVTEWPVRVLTARDLGAGPDPGGRWRSHQRQALMSGQIAALSLPPVCPVSDRRAIINATGPGGAILTPEPQAWIELGLDATYLGRDGDISDDMIARDSSLSGLADRLTGRLSLDDLVLSRRSRAALDDLTEAAETLQTVLETWQLGAVWGKTSGLAALFKGPSGTGKTTAAAAVGLALGLPVYRVNLAGLISKYIGETEKHLDRLFAAAEGQKIILLFDEADAIFGKRSEVQDAHDRYANTGTAYLLQRLENHAGLSILTTNLADNIDDAFLRRIDAVIDFPTPGPEEREALWHRITLSDAPLGALDFAALAAHTLTGGEIRNCCLTAAYRAARIGNSITMEGLAHAIAQELTKKGKPVRRADFKDLYTARKGAR